MGVRVLGWVRAVGRFVRTYPVTLFWAIILLLIVWLMCFANEPYQGKGGSSATVSQNGYEVVWASSSHTLYRWNIPGSNHSLLLRRGPAGMIMAQHAYWYHREIGSLDYLNDDYGYALRRISGTYQWSNHASGTAVDLNFTSHPVGSYRYDSGDLARIRNRLFEMRGVIRWGGNYRYPDEMHWEIYASRAKVNALADWLRTTYYGKKLLAANPNR